MAGWIITAIILVVISIKAATGAKIAIFVVVIGFSVI
jgi:hypothetical protein